jgi:protein-L-isoaspartate(D-aspartate) O-methyltransferase
MMSPDTATMPLESDFDRLREQMVQRQIAARGIGSPLVLAAMRKVRREAFVAADLGEFAYEDRPLPIEEQQTISQPYIVAYMIDALGLRGGERVLEVGTGSGYVAALLAGIAAQVFTIERHAELARTARARLVRDGCANVEVRHGDGTLGWPEAAPFDAIVVSACAALVPDALRLQLADGGRLVIPVGTAVDRQKLVRIARVGPARFEEQALTEVRFVPLVGAGG